MNSWDGVHELTGATVDPRRLGGKAVGLATLLRAGARIPPTWVLPVDVAPTTADLRRLAELAPRWAVRSSAPAEDGTTRSYAGMFHTELDVSTVDLTIAVARVRASADSPRVGAYRAQSDAAGAVAGMAVVLQPYRTPVAAGLWLGRGLSAGRLEWTPGSGDRLVSGAVTPRWEEWTSTGLATDSGADVLHTDNERVGERCLALQRTLGVPADLEFAVLDDGLVWLQFRPVTAALAAPITTATATTSGTVHGIPASTGRATGTPSRPRAVDDPQWTPGAVLLTDRTDPDWVPLMAESAALVTAEGGLLCHAAIVARELGVPCVTGVGAEALARLSSSAELDVDGAAGTVSIVR